MKEERKIAVERPQSSAADLAFAELMQRTEKYMNDLSLQNPRLYKEMEASDLEEDSCNSIQAVCSGTIFKPEDIKLVSGHSFPDIVAQGTFGVEVKSTKENHWTSTGSSIVESTRDREILNIYMLFGKLGGTPPEFKCRPYQDVLKEIAVTHSPRYLIDMELTPNDTIFEKMGIPYEVFRNDGNKIDIVRDYYRKKYQSSNKKVVPWWLGSNSTVAMSVMRRGAMAAEERDKLTAEMLILFPDVISGNYDEAAVWLCTRRNTINPSFRDLFSAGGRCSAINGKKLAVKLPHIVGTLLEHNELVKNILSNNIDNIYTDIKSVWPQMPSKPKLYREWVKLVDCEFKNNAKLDFINITELLMNNSKVTSYTD